MCQVGALGTDQDVVSRELLDLNAARAHVANDPANRTADVLGTMAGEAPGFTFV